MPKSVETRSLKQKGKKQQGGGLHWEIGGEHGFRFLRFWLSPGEMIIADGGSMVYMDDSITLQLTKPKQKGGFVSALKKGLAGESIFQSYYVAGDKQYAILALSTPLPSDIIAITLQEGETYKLTAGAFLAATPNVKISGKFGFRGIFTGESAFLTTATAVQGEGIVWIAAYGHIEQHELNRGEGLKIDNECFVACPSDVKYELGKAGKSLMGSFFSKEGIVMHFKGPATVYTSTAGVGALARHLAPLMSPYLSRSSGPTIELFG